MKGYPTIPKRQDRSLTIRWARSSNALRSPFWTLVQSEAPKRNNGRFEAVRLPVSAGLTPGRRAATSTPLFPIVLTLSLCIAQSTGAVEYTYCASAEG